MSEQSANTNFLNLIVTKDNIDDEENDLVYKSGVKFEFKQSGNYNSEIMSFLNYLINQTATKKKKFEEDVGNIFEKIFNKK